jgi:hypothetical protein
VVRLNLKKPYDFPNQLLQADFFFSEEPQYNRQTKTPIFIRV